MRKLLLTIAVVAVLTWPAVAKNTVSCTGSMIDVFIDARADFPVAIVYDADNDRTCVLDRGRAGHDPLRGNCIVGDRCTIHGVYRRVIGNTYWLNFGEADVDGPPSRREVPSGR